MKKVNFFSFCYIFCLWIAQKNKTKFARQYHQMKAFFVLKYYLYLLKVFLNKQGHSKDCSGVEEDVQVWEPKWLKLISMKEGKWENEMRIWYLFNMSTIYISAHLALRFRKSTGSLGSTLFSPLLLSNIARSPFFYTRFIVHILHNYIQ